MEFSDGLVIEDNGIEHRIEGPEQWPFFYDQRTIIVCYGADCS